MNMHIKHLRTKCHGEYLNLRKPQQSWGLIEFRNWKYKFAVVSGGVIFLPKFHENLSVGSYIIWGEGGRYINVKPNNLKPVYKMRRQGKKKRICWMNVIGLVWPATAEPCSTAANAEFSISTKYARIRWANPVLSSWSAAAGTKANVGSAGTFSYTVSNAPSPAGCQDALGWSTVCKVRFKMSGRFLAIDISTQTAHYKTLQSNRWLCTFL